MAAVEECKGLRVAVEGCGHGTLNDIYASIKLTCEVRGWDGVDLVIIGGDFQAVRNSLDLNCMSVPPKFRAMMDFHEYYSGVRKAPYLTIFIGGNHEASNYLFELYYGGWVAPNIYYLGAANVIRVGPLRIAALSGIFKHYDYWRPHHERLPYNDTERRTIYHTREIDTRKLVQIRTQVDIGLSHDWPRGVEFYGNQNQLFRYKPYLEPEARAGTLNSLAAKIVMRSLKPAYWFSAHHHAFYTAILHYMPNRFRITPVSGAASHSVPSPTSGQPPAKRQRQRSSETKEEIEVKPALTETGKKNHEEIELDLEEDDSDINLAPAPMPPTPVVPSVIPMPPSPVGVDVRTGENLPDPGNRATEKANGMPSAGPSGFSTSTKDEAEIELDLEEEGPAGGVGVMQMDHSDAKPDGHAPADASSSPAASSHTAKAIPQDVQFFDTGKHVTPEPEAPEPSTATSLVPDDLRDQLPDSFKAPEKPVWDPAPPTDNNNTTTRFLALGKVGPKSDFLRLLELEPCEKPLDGCHDISRPVKLQYDAEWLAITRVFADHIILGDRHAKIPADKRKAHYRPLIEEQEKWIDEHIVKPGKLDVPENFEVVAPVYDATAASHGPDDMPLEYSNPQTEAFCNLVGIENPFKLSGEDALAKNEAGPRPLSPRAQEAKENRRGRGGFRGRGASRGRGGFGARGGGRGSWRGGGRGRGQD